MFIRRSNATGARPAEAVTVLAEELWLALLPPGAVGATSDGRSAASALAPSEAVAVRGSAAGRRQEFAAGRACARVALGRLGRPPQPTPVGPDREPLWPAGIVGSITHCADFCAAAVAESTDIAGLGIDAERTLPVAAGFARRVAGEAELAAAAAELAVAGTALDPAILLFSAKESAYKAWFPMTGERLGFRDCTVTLDRSSSTFTVSVHPPGRQGSPPVLQGRWAATGSHVFTVAHTRSGAGIRSSGSRGRQGAPG